MSEQQGQLDIGRVLSLTPTDTNRVEVEEVMKALGSDKRLAILEYLGAHTSSVLEIAAAFGWPPSTVALHIKVLEHAGLIHTEIRPASRGLQKLCARVYDRVNIELPLERVEGRELGTRRRHPQDHSERR